MIMGRPLGCVNREKPFYDTLRMTLRQRPHNLRRIVDRFLDKAEEGDLRSAREVIGRLHGTGTDNRPSRRSGYGASRCRALPDRLRAN